MAANKKQHWQTPRGCLPAMHPACRDALLAGAAARPTRKAQETWDGGRESVPDNPDASLAAKANTPIVNDNRKVTAGKVKCLLPTAGSPNSREFYDYADRAGLASPVALLALRHNSFPDNHLRKPADKLCQGCRADYFRSKLKSLAAPAFTSAVSPEVAALEYFCGTIQRYSGGTAVPPAETSTPGGVLSITSTRRMATN